MCLSATKDRMEKKCESVRFDEMNYSRRGESDGVNARDCENKLARRWRWEEVDRWKEKSTRNQGTKVSFADNRETGCGASNDQKITHMLQLV